MPSPSLSGSGQPSSSWNPSLSSGSLGHLSSASGMPSWSLSRSGQPSSSSKPSLSSGSLGHLSSASGIPSPSVSKVLGGAGATTTGLPQTPAGDKRRASRALASAISMWSSARKYSPRSSSRSANSTLASESASGRGAHW